MSTTFGMVAVRSIPILLGLCLLWIWISRPSPLPPLRSGADDTLRVAAANLLYSNGNAQEVSELVEKLQLDVLILLEWTPTNVDLDLLKQSSLHPILQHESHGKGLTGLCVLTRDGLDAVAEVAPAAHKSSRCRLPMATVRLTMGADSLSFLGIHPPPPTPRCGLAADSAVKVIASWIHEGQLNKRVGACLPGDPVLVLGDFNLPPFWPALRQLKDSGLVDAYASTNWRPGPTWGPTTWFPAVGRIDYAFVPDSLAIQGAWNLDVPGSDHRMIVVDLSLESVSKTISVNTSKSASTPKSVSTSRS